MGFGHRTIGSPTVASANEKRRFLMEFIILADRGTGFAPLNGQRLKGNGGSQTKKFSQMGATPRRSQRLSHRTTPSLVKPPAEQVADIGGTALAVGEWHVVQIGLYVQNLKILVDRHAYIDAVYRIA